jgi:uncharacterized membrane protein YtjA (UPF0391 family)
VLYCAAVFLAIAVIAAVLGFTGLALALAWLAKLLFFVFLVLAVLSFAWDLRKRRKRGKPDGHGEEPRRPER